MSNLFGRRVKVILAFPIAEDFATVTAQTIEITDLRVQFKITKTLDKTPNSAEISITNLSAQTRGQLPGKDAKVILLAGYEDTIGQIYAGDARLINSQRDGVDWVTKIECGDGERAIRGGRVSESWAGGTEIASVIRTIGKSTGIPTGNLADVAQGSNIPGQYVQGYAVHGSASRELDKVLKSQGYEFSIQDGALQILKIGGVTSEQIVNLDQNSGLIGSPEFGSAESQKKPPVLKVKSLLQPQIKPGRRIQVTSVNHNGVFRIEKVTHTGDTKGGEWYTEAEVATV